MAATLNLEFSACDGSCAQNPFSFQYRVIQEGRGGLVQYICVRVGSVVQAWLLHDH